MSKALLPAYESQRDRALVEKNFGAEIRENWRQWIRDNERPLQEEILLLLKTATREDMPRVVLANKLLDKMLPDQREWEPNQGKAGGQNVQIVIHGLERGPQSVRKAVTVDAEQAAD